MIQLSGISNIDSNGQFHFESYCSSDSRILARPIRKRGTMTIGSDLSADFVPDANRIYLPPLVDVIARGEDYHIKRTTRNYIIQVKVPILESRRETEKKLRGMLPEIVGEITLDRNEILH